MAKITTIIKREYITRVRKKSFIIMTLLIPVIFGGMIGISVLIMENQDKDFKKIAIIEDGSDLFRNVIPDTKDVDFEYLDNVSLDDLKNTFEEAGYYGVLFISPQVISIPNAIQLISNKQPPLDLLNHIERSLEKDIEREKLLNYNIDNLEDILKSVKTNVSVQTIRIDESGEIKETNTGIAMALAYLGAFLMYMVVLLFGVQVMRGVTEEKNNRIVEVIISSVKPVELMMGKILGIALVGLTQFTVWIVLTTAIIVAVKSSVLPADQQQLTEISQSVMSQAANEQLAINDISDSSAQAEEFSKLFNNLLNAPWTLIIISFIFYFTFICLTGGKSNYASIFAAIGSAVDNETDTQQFMFPIMLPIILGLFVAMGTMQNPESSLSFWFSMIPLTSPIVMMARIPFEVPVWEIVLSLTILIGTFIGFVFILLLLLNINIILAISFFNAFIFPGFFN